MMADVSSFIVIFASVFLAWFAGQLLAFFGVFPHVGYLLTGVVAGKILSPDVISVFFAFGISLFLTYLGYVASSCRLFTAPFQLVFAHPLRIAVGFFMFFSFLYFSGLSLLHATLFGFLLATSSALVISWGKNASYSLIESSILSMDALLSALALMLLLHEPLTGILVSAVIYLALIYLRSDIWNLLALSIAFALLPYGVVGPLSVAFISGVVFHHIFHNHRMHWAEPIFHRIFPLLFLTSIAAVMPIGFDVFSLYFVLVIALISFLQNFISLVILGPLFGVAPKTGAHISVRTFGPSEAALFAVLFTGASASLVLGVFLFYVLALIVSSFVRTEKDAEHFLSTMVPKSIFRPIEELDAAYASVFVRHHVIFSDAYREDVGKYAKSFVTALVLLLVSVYAIVYLVFNRGLTYWSFILLASILVVIISLKKIVETFIAMYVETLAFISRHAYSDRLRLGKDPYRLVSGYVLTLLGVLGIPISILLANIVFLFVALLVLNIGLYLMLSAHARIYTELVRQKDYTPQ